MKLISLFFQLLLLSAPATASRVLRGQSQVPTRLFRTPPKKTANDVNGGDKLSFSSSNGSSSGSIKSSNNDYPKKKCKMKRVPVSSSGISVAHAAGAVDPMLTSTSSTMNNGRTTTVPTTTGTTTTITTTSTTTSTSTASSSGTTKATSSNLFASTIATTAVKTATKATASSAAGVVKSSASSQADLKGESQQVPKGLPRGKATESETSQQQDELTQNQNDFDLLFNQEYEYVNICDQDGNLIEPNTFWPTASPKGDYIDLVDIVESDHVDVSFTNEGGEEIDVIDTVDQIDETDNDEQDQLDILDGTDNNDILDMIDTKPPTSSPIKSGFIFQPTQETSYSPGCSDFQNNKVYITSLPARVVFTYEILVNPETNVDYMVQMLEVQHVKLLGSELIQCESIRMLRQSRQQHHQQHQQYHHQRRRLESKVDGIDPSPPDVTTQEPCTHFTSSPSSTCYVIQGELTLYLRENSVQSSASQSSTDALKILMEGFNNDNSQFLSGGQYGVNGLKGIHFISGEPDQDLGYGHDNETPSTLNVGGAAAAEMETGEETKSLTTVGISLLTLGGVAILSLLLLVTKKTRDDVKVVNKQETYAEFYDDNNDFDKDDLSANDKTITGSETDNDSPNKVAIVYNEGNESIYTDYNASAIIRELHLSECAAKAHEIPNDDRSTKKQPIFLKTYDMDPTVENVEVNLNETLNSNQSIYIHNREVERPTFVNPARLGMGGGKRGYKVDDTVQF